MSEYIVNIPADYNRDGVYYPDERHEPMAVREEITRCRDCRYMTSDMRINYCIRPAEYHEFAVEPDGFCAWSERRESC